MTLFFLFFHYRDGGIVSDTRRPSVERSNYSITVVKIREIRHEIRYDFGRTVFAN